MASLSAHVESCMPQPIHSDASTTGLYDRRKKKIRRNIVERVSVK